MKVLIAGATGFVGKSIVRHLSYQGYTVKVLSRSPSTKCVDTNHDVETISWSDHDAILETMESAKAIINLSGEPIAGKRWSQNQKEKILNSRIATTETLSQMIAKTSVKPACFINASAIGYYGNNDHDALTEEAPQGEGFLSEVCARWEKSALVSHCHTRVVLIRIGIVLEKDGGALKKMLPPFRCFIGGPLGSGKQWMSWIHRDDLVKGIQFIIENNSIEGPVNLTAPHPERMSAFSKKLGLALRRPSLFPVPGFVLKILLGEMSSMLLTGQKIIPSVLEKNGFHFKYPHLQNALHAILET